MGDIKLKDVFNKESINNRAKEHWDYKDEQSRLKAGYKYNHIFIGKTEVIHDWSNIFDKLSRQQQAILIKGELIRTYDALPNIDKTYLKNKFKLSVFASKWYKLPSSDKNKLLKFVI